VTDRTEPLDDEQLSRGASRRRFLTRAGLGGVGVAVAGSGLLATPARAATPTVPAPRTPLSAPAGNQVFTRMFPGLPPFAEATDQVRAALLEVGRAGGIMDARDDLAADPKLLITDPTKDGEPAGAGDYGVNPDNPTMTAGSTFVGQFTDHDITFDQTSPLGVPTNPALSPNTRSAALDLDSVFGGGPGVRPELYEQNADGTVGPRLRIGSTPNGLREDHYRVLQTDGSWPAVLGDPRNDENLVTAGLHCAHVLFYNRVLDDLADLDLSAFPAAAAVGQAALSSSMGRYLVARQITVWHYQWLLVHEHLPQICGQDVVNDVLARGARYYRPEVGGAQIPVEFSGAAYRFGHSQVRPSYRANFTSGGQDSRNTGEKPFFGLVFSPDEPQTMPVTTDRADLLGGFRADRRYIGWQTFFDFGDGQAKPNKRIDPRISSVLFALPGGALAPHSEIAPLVLPQRTLLRQLTWSLPSGQRLARAMGADPLTTGDLDDIRGVYAPFASSTPLWYYVLAEARAANAGLSLGPVGGRIVAETLIGLLRADPVSYLSAYPAFRPFLGTELSIGAKTVPTLTGDRSYTRAHFLYHAGVVQPGVYR
jgi:hypothetical protein